MTTVKFDGGRELAKFLAGSEEVQTAFAEQLFQHLVKQPVACLRAATIGRNCANLSLQNGCSIRKLIGGDRRHVGADRTRCETAAEIEQLTYVGPAS